MLHIDSGERAISGNLTIAPDKTGDRTGETRGLPRARRWEMIEACRQLTDTQARDVLRTRLLPFIFMPGEILYAAADCHGLSVARQRGVEVIATARRDDMLHALQVVFGKQILHNSRHHLANDMSVYSASKRLTRLQAGFLLAVVVVTFYGFWFNPENTFIIFSAIFATMFFAVITLRLASIFPIDDNAAPPTKPLADAELPIYTVLVPLFQETGVINQLLTGLCALNYPASKLDIKLILEEKDTATRQAVAELALPPQFEVIVVPHAKPQTKPKALNYALHFARGELVVIFDAEDVPEPGQLRLAAETFAAIEPEIVCLQARLTFYNVNENWLTRQFTIEYAVLFDLVLPLLASMELPLPLGGTSNHFRMTALRKLGAWDPYNVTEDADLGIRLARFGWRADVLESTTFEEANNEFSNWISQRSRWLKGWIQTWFVHMRNPYTLWQELGAAGFLTVQVIMAGIVISTLVHPVFLGAIFWALATGSLFPPEKSVSSAVLIGTGLALFITGYGVTLWAGLVALRLRGLQQLRLSVLAMPIYWILISFSGWLAVKQFITHPFHWNKTAHGLSKLNRGYHRRN